MSNAIKTLNYLTKSLLYHQHHKSELKSTFLIRKRYLSSPNTDNVEYNINLNQLKVNPSLISDSKPSYPVNTPKIEEEIEIDEDVEYLTDEIAEKFKIPEALDICNKDLSNFKAPCLKPTFNFAAYANESETIQELVKLGVDLHKVEQNPENAKSILRRNFDEFKPYIHFLHDCGVPADEIGSCLTRFPKIIDEDLDDLHTRIRYLRAHHFSLEDVSLIIRKCPVWLSYSTRQIDSKLGYIQSELKLTGEQLRAGFISYPMLILAKKANLRENIFSVREEMEFSEDEMKMIFLNKPQLYFWDRKLTAQQFAYVYNELGIPHSLLAQMPLILTFPLRRTEERHEFLKLFKRNQYDPKKPLYVSPSALVGSNDHEFCSNIAKTSIELYDMYLKTR